MSSKHDNRNVRRSKDPIDIKQETIDMLSHSIDYIKSLIEYLKYESSVKKDEEQKLDCLKSM